VSKADKVTIPKDMAISCLVALVGHANYCKEQAAQCLGAGLFELSATWVRRAALYDGIFEKMDVMVHE
jgi:hypothetical protein